MKKTVGHTKWSHCRLMLGLIMIIAKLHPEAKFVKLEDADISVLKCAVYL